jgi:hypothetical protein
VTSYSSLRWLVDQKIVEFLSTFDRSNKPTRSCAPTCPGFAGGTTIFRRDFRSLQCASLARIAEKIEQDLPQPHGVDGVGSFTWR